MAAPLAELARAVRLRLLALRDTAHVNEHIRFLAQNEGLVAVVPRWDARHGTCVISSWESMRKTIAAGFEKEELVFMRPQQGYPLALRVPFVAMPFGDGTGGLWASVTCPKGAWKGMWEGAGLDEILGDDA